MLVKGNLSEFSAHASMDHLWIYIPLAFFVMYPFLHDCTVSCYHSIENYLFDGESTRIGNNVYIHESTTEPNDGPEKPTTTSRRSSADSSIGSIHLDYTNAAARNWTAEKLLAEETKASDPAKKPDQRPVEPSQPQRFWSDSQPAELDPFAFSDHPSESNGNDGFQFPTAPDNQSNSLTQGRAAGNPDNAADQDPPMSSQKAARPLDTSSTLNSDFSEMSFVPPTGSVSERFPEFVKGNRPNPTLDFPSAADGSSHTPSTPGPAVPAGPSKPSAVSNPPKTRMATSRSNVQELKKKDDPSFDDHITPPEQPKFARRPFSHADELARFAAKKQSVNDLADQMGVFLKQVASGDLPKSNTAASTNVKPRASHSDAPRHTQQLPKQASKKKPLHGDADPTKAQRGEASQKANNPTLPRQNPPNTSVDAPPPSGLSSSSTKFESSLTEAVANAPFMPRRKTQPKAAPTTVKLSFSRFKTGPDDSLTDPSNVAGPSSAPQSQPSCTPGPSTASNLPSSSTNTNKKRDAPKSSLSPKPQFAYSPGSLRSPTAKTTSQSKGAPTFTSSFKHLRGPSGIHTVVYASPSHNPSPAFSNIETSVVATSSTAPVESGFSDTKTSAFPVLLMGNQSSGTTNQASLEAGITLNLSDENFFAAAPGTAQPSSVASSINSRVGAESSEHLTAASFANDPQSFSSTPHVSESNQNGFESVGILAAGKAEPAATAAASVGKREPKETQAAAYVAATATSSDQSSSDSIDATYDDYSQSSTTTAREARKEARYAAKIAAIFPLTTPKEHAQNIASGTPLYTAVSLSATAAGPSTTLQHYAASSSGTGSNIDRSPILLVDTDTPEADAKNTVSSLLICRPAEVVEVYPPEGLVSAPCSEVLHWNNLMILL